jgi:IclR family transcriptional regulator, blcABC operon repressor
MSEAKKAGHLVPAVARAAAILDLIGQSGQALGSNEIARQLDFPKSSTANICLELLEAGMLVRRDNGYALGRKLVELGGHYLSSVDALREYYDMCSSLPILSRESSRIAILDGTDVLYLGKYEGRQQIRLTANIGDRFPAVCTATGKALMALLPKGEAEERYREKPTAFVQLTPKSVKNVTELSAMLEQARKVGYAIDDEETTMGVICYGVAVSGFRGDTSSVAVSATVLKQRLTPEFKQALLNDLFALAKGLSNPLVTRS